MPSLVGHFSFPLSIFASDVHAAILIYTFAHFSDKLKMRSPFILTGLAMCLVGFSINISKAPSGAKYFGTFLCTGGSYAIIPGVIAWYLFFIFSSFVRAQKFRRLGNNLSGHYKRGIGMAIQPGIGNFGGLMAINFYRSQDSPRFIFGREACLSISALEPYERFLTDALELMFVAIGLIMIPLVVFSYIRINRKRDASEKAALEDGKPAKYTTQELQMMGDRAPDFRYTL